MSAKELSVLRDVQVAKDIGILSDLGKFPKEIVAYGLVYYKENQRQYLISCDKTKLITFINDVSNHSYYPTPINVYSERLLVPAGYEEDISIRVKLILARQLQEKYPLSLFETLDQLANVEASSVLEKPLLDYRDELEGVFQLDKISAFSTICTKAFLRKSISHHCYYLLDQWCQKRISLLESYTPPAGRKEKVFFGFAAIKDSQIIDTCINAHLSYIYEKNLAFTQQGYLTTNWHKKVYDLDCFSDSAQVCKQMDLDLRLIYDNSLLSLLHQVEHSAIAINQQQYAQLLASLSDKQNATEMVCYYGKLWGIQ